MNYTTQMDAARKGIITKELQAVAEKEQMDRRTVAARSFRQSRDLCQQKSQMHRSAGCRFHVKDQDQCKSWNLQRL